MPDNELELVEKAKAGDASAFRLLLERHYMLMYRVAYRFTGNRQDAEDVAQEICVALPAKLRSFRGDSTVTTWLYRVTVNACRDYIKKRSNSRSLEQRYMELEESLSAEQQEGRKKTAWLYRQIAALKPPLPETALLVLTEDLSHAEAGKILGCAESTVSWRMYEVKKQLKEAMETNG